MAVVLLRLGGDPLTHIWAEDGGIFLRGALNDTVAGALTTTYAGYSHLVPRLCAEFAALFPIEWAAAVLALEGAAVTVLCAFVVWHVSAPHLPDRRLRGLLTAMVLLLPVVGFESLANVTNLQWFMLFASFWLLLWRPASWPAALAAGAFVALTLASAPLALLLTPLAVWRVARATRDRIDMTIAAAFAVGAAIQLVAIVTDDSVQAASRWDWDLLPAYLVRVVAGLGLGHNADTGAWQLAPLPLLVVAGFAFAAVVAASFLRDIPGRAVSLVALALSVALFLIPGYVRDAALPLMWTDDYHGTYGARYAILPALFLLAAVLIQLQTRPPGWTAAAWTRLRIGVVALLAAAAVTTFYVGDPGRRTVRWSDTIEQARLECRSGVAVATEVPVSWPDWRINLPCERL